MKVLIDACVLYPTLLREIVVGAAKAGLFTPFWSHSILEEWRHAMARDGEEGRIAVEAEIARLNLLFPDAAVDAFEDLSEDLNLPDPDDRHVLAAAIAGRCDELLTLNLKDFPSRTLTSYGVLRRDPDGFLFEMHSAHPEVIGEVVNTAVSAALRRKPDVSERGLMKRARVPRLGKALYD